MKRITTIIEADADGTVHLPVPPELRHGKLEITATIRPVADANGSLVRQRRAAIEQLRRLGGLSREIPDLEQWQRDQRADRALPGQH